MALTEFDRSANSRCAIITLHTVLPARPLPLKNFEQALGSLSERVERGPELIQPRVKVVQVSGARGRRCRENAGGWSRGAGLRTVFESLYGVAMRIRLKTIEAWWLARKWGGNVDLMISLSGRGHGPEWCGRVPEHCPVYRLQARGVDARPEVALSTIDRFVRLLSRPLVELP